MRVSILICLFIASIFSSHLLAQEQDKIGVLLLAHGSMNKTWNNAIEEAAKPVGEDYLVEIAWGMANPLNMQPSLEKLEASGVTDIVVVQLFVSSYSPIIRQNEYLLGFREELADAPMPIMIHDMQTGRMTVEMPENLQPLNFDANIVLTDPINDHPLAAEILHERVLALSTSPSEETILLVAHGPNDEDDNKKWVSSLYSLGEQIQKLQNASGIPFMKFKSLTVRDDAGEEVHEKARLEFREKVEQADLEGTAIVIPVLMANGGVESKYVQRLEGLSYKWSGEALLPHENISTFIQKSVEEGVSLIKQTTSSIQN